MKEVQGRLGWFGVPFKSGHSIYIYFAVDDSFKSDGTMNTIVELEYFDATSGQLSIEFDGSDPSAAFGGAYSRGDGISLAGDKRWKTASFKLDGARFLNSQNAGADFRVVAEATEFGLNNVTLRRH